MEEIRSFIAIELTEHVLRSLREVQERLGNMPAGHFARWVRPEGVHLTLKFLGSVPANRISAVAEGMRQACVGTEPFWFDVVGLGCFPNARRPRVLWVGIQEEGEQLVRLQRAIDREMEALGYPSEKRAFHPHLTLARIRKDARSQEQEALGHLVMTTAVGELGRVRVERVNLMRSDLRPGGAVYSQLALAELNAP